MGEEDVWAQMGLPTGFGKQTVKKKIDIAARINNTKRATVATQKPETPPALDATSNRTTPIPDGSGPPTLLSGFPHEDGESDSGDDDDVSIDGAFFPITHEITLKDHSKVVSALALDPSGARIASGSHDYDCKLWDFGGMNASLKPFKSWEPAGSYHVSVIWRFGALRRVTRVNRTSFLKDSRAQVFQCW